MTSRGRNVSACAGLRLSAYCFASQHQLGRRSSATADCGPRCAQRQSESCLYAIETEALTKRFRQLQSYRDLALYPWRRSTQGAVEDVTLQIHEGELFGLLGENGAGKTTLIRMLSTTLLPTSGTALVRGHDVVRDPYAVRRLIGLVSGDERTFYWRLTGRQNLEFFAALYHVPRDVAPGRIGELLQTLDVASYADRRFSTYSTGIRQKFAIARGMLTKPSVLFLDEPTRALDPIAADELRRYIAEHIVGRLGHTVLLATHTLSEAEAICHRVAIIRHGKVYAAGTMDELSARMALSPVLEVTIAGDPDELREAIGAVPGIGTVSAHLEGDRVHLAIQLGAQDGMMRDVLRVVVETGARVESCTTRRPTLDDIYRTAHAQD